MLRDLLGNVFFIYNKYIIHILHTLYNIYYINYAKRAILKNKIEQKKRGSVFFVQFVFQNRAFCVVDVIYII